MDKVQSVAPIGERFALTLTQQDIYFDQYRHPDSPLYNVGGYIKMGCVDVDKLTVAHRQLVQSEAAFGIRIVTTDQGVEQYISAQRSTHLSLVDFSDASDATASASAWLKAKFESTLDIENVELFTSALLKLSADDYWYVGIAHHLAMDGWGFANWAKKLGQIYNQDELVLDGDKSVDHWRNIALKDNQYVAGAKYQADKKFWSAQDGLTPDRLLAAHPHQSAQTRTSSRKLVPIDEHLLIAVNGFAQQYAVGASHVFLAMVSSYFSQIYSQNDLVFGLPAHNRRNHQQKQMLGVFTSISPIAIHLPKAVNFVQLAQTIGEQQKQNFRHQRYPIGHIINDLQLTGDDKSIYDICYNYLSLDSQLSFEGQSADLVYLSHNHNETPLMITVWQYGESHRSEDGQQQGYSEIQIDHNVDFFDDVQIEQMGRGLTYHLQQLLLKPHQPIQDVPYLPKVDSHYLIEQLNDNHMLYPQSVLIHQLFERQVTQTPKAIALSCGQQLFTDEQLTYQQLNQRANQLAHYLRHKDVSHQGKNQFVGIATGRGIEMVVAVLAVLKSGASYVSLDLNYPPQRLRNIVEDSGMSVILTLANVSSQVGDIVSDNRSIEVISLDEQADDIEQQSGENLALNLSSDSLAYLIYTSGSTGKPKGVAVRHRNTCAMLHWAKGQYSSVELSQVLASTSLSFDLSIFELFVPLSFGHECVLVQSALDLIEHPIKVSLINTVPSAIKALMAERAIPSTVQVINLAGEALSASVVNDLLNDNHCQKVCNLYGPSEDTTYSTFVQYTQPISTMVSIGKPINNTQAYVLNEQQKLVPAGVVGQLYLAGAGVAQGYLHQAQLTAERFIDNPFSCADCDDKLYQTGDLVYLLTDSQQQGELAFVGRMDDQVKIRGFRIELGEIEHQLTALDGVASSLVVSQLNDTGEPLLVAYVVAEDKDINDQKFVADLKSSLGCVLPDHMLPSVFMVIAQWPLLPNGKIARQALPKANWQNESENIVSPNNANEQQLRLVFATLLGLCEDKLSCTASFFDLGGHSLLAVKLVGAVRAQFNVDISLKQVFEYPTVQTLARFIEQCGDKPLRAGIVKQDYKAQAPLSFAQRRLWFVDQFEGSSAHYNMAMAIEVVGSFELAIAEQAIQAIIARHEVLRTVYRRADDQTGQGLVDAVQLINPVANFTIPTIDLSKLEVSKQPAQVQKLAAEDALTSFDLSGDLMLRVSWICLDKTSGQQRGVLLFNMHHIAFDGWSVKLLINEFTQLYLSLSCQPSQSHTDIIAPLAIQYADYAMWQRDYLHSAVEQSSSNTDENQTTVHQQQLDYWLAQLADAPAEHSLPLDCARPVTAQYQGGLVKGIIDSPMTLKLSQLATELSITPFMLMHSTFALLLSRHSNNKDIVVGTTTANRLQAEVADLIGFFVNTLVLRVNCDGNDSFNDHCAKIKKVNIDAQAHQDIPFDHIVEQLAVEQLAPSQAQSSSPVFQIMLTMDNDAVQDLQLDGLTFTPRSNEIVSAKFDITLDFSWTEQGIVLNWIYDTALFNLVTIERLNQHLQTLLLSLVAVDSQTLLGCKTSSIEMLSAQEKHYLLHELNDTTQSFSPDIDPQKVLLHELFETHAMQTPDVIAVQYQGRDGTTCQLTYQQLNQRSNQLAHYLRYQGVDVGMRIGVCVERSIEMMIGIIATLKVGGIFVSIDPNYPASRLQHMISDSDISQLLTVTTLAQNLPVDADVNLVLMDNIDSIVEPLNQSLTINLEDNLEPSPLQHPANLAYVIYTSGSTGKPKGVECFGASVINLLNQFESLAPVSAPSKVLMWTSVSFDVAVYEMMSALIYGRSLHITCDEIRLDTDKVFDYMVQQQIASTYLPPFMIKDFLSWLNQQVTQQLPLPPLERLLVGVEAILLADLQGIKAVIPGIEIINGYGPSEATVCATLYTIDDNPQPQLTFAPIGRPVNNCQVLVLDEQLKLVPLGGCGELYIGGAGLAQGYINQPAQTAQRFVDNPYSDKPNSRLYKTGDLVRYLPDLSNSPDANGEPENLLFVGRIDEQVKVNGVRIELGEIESQLEKLDTVHSNHVLLNVEQVDDNMVKRLIAYIKPQINEPDCNQLGMAAGKAISPQAQASFCADIRLALSKTLPAHMIPTGFVLVDEWPFTVNGKLDKKALSSMAIVTSSYEPASTETEADLVELVARIIDFDQQKLSVTTSFFELGLSSLKLFSVISEVNRQFSITLSPTEIYNKSTIQLLAAYVNTLRLTTMMSCDDEDQSFEEDGEI